MDNNELLQIGPFKIEEEAEFGGASICIGISDSHLLVLIMEIV